MGFIDDNQSKEQKDVKKQSFFQRRGYQNL